MIKLVQLNTEMWTHTHTKKIIKINNSSKNNWKIFKCELYQSLFNGIL